METMSSRIVTLYYMPCWRDILIFSCKLVAVPVTVRSWSKTKSNKTSRYFYFLEKTYITTSYASYEEKMSLSVNIVVSQHRFGFGQSTSSSHQHHRGVHLFYSCSTHLIVLSLPVEDAGLGDVKKWRWRGGALLSIFSLVELTDHQDVNEQYFLRGLCL